MDHQHRHSPDQIVEIPEDPVPQPPQSDDTVVYLPAGQLYHRYPSTSRASTGSSVDRTHTKPTTLRTIVCWAVFSILISILSFLIFVFVLYIALRPKAPRFAITDVILNESSKGNGRNCKLWLSAHNPNAHLGLYVKHHGGGYAALYLDQQEIAKGLPPDVYLMKSNITSFKLLLEGSQEGASREIWEEEIRFKMNVKVRLKIWLLKAWDMKMDVRCTFKANRQVSNGTHILSQTCKDKIKF